MRLTMYFFNLGFKLYIFKRDSLVSLKLLTSQTQKLERKLVSYKWLSHRKKLGICINIICKIEIEIYISSIMEWNHQIISGK